MNARLTSALGLVALALGLTAGCAQEPVREPTKPVADWESDLANEIIVIEYAFALRRAGEEKFITCGDGVHISPGDQFKVYLRTTHPVFLYLYRVDSREDAIRLHPEKKNANASVPEDAEFVFPSRDTAFEFEEGIFGVESFHLLCSRFPIEDEDDDTIMHALRQRTLSSAGIRPVHDAEHPEEFKRVDLSTKVNARRFNNPAEDVQMVRVKGLTPIIVTNVLGVEAR
jgi:hypothetical protein